MVLSSLRYSNMSWRYRKISRSVFGQIPLHFVMEKRVIELSSCETKLARAGLKVCWSREMCERVRDVSVRADPRIMPDISGEQRGRKGTADCRWIDSIVARELNGATYRGW